MVTPHNGKPQEFQLLCPWWTKGGPRPVALAQVEGTPRPTSCVPVTLGKADRFLLVSWLPIRFSVVWDVGFIGG